jgi:large subunit ribosomal protein L25
VPAVVYGRGAEAQAISVQRGELERIVASGSPLVSLVTASHGAKHVLVKEVQYHPIGGHILHADFVEVAMDELVTVRVPIALHGRAAGIQEGGTVDQPLHELEISALPADIPSEIRVEITDLRLGSHVSVKDLHLPEKVRALTPADTMVAQCRKRVEEAAAAPAAPAEGEVAAAGVMPEVIVEKKAEERAAEAAAEKKEEAQ